MRSSRANMKKPLVVEEQSESEESMSEGEEEGGMNLSGNKLDTSEIKEEPDSEGENLDTSEIKEEPESEAEEDVTDKSTMRSSRANMKKPLVVEEQSESEESMSEGEEEDGNNLDTSEVKEEPESETEEDINENSTSNQSENEENDSEDENVNASDSEATNEDDQIESEVSDSDQKNSSNKPKLSLKKGLANPSTSPKNIEADSDSEEGEDELNDNFDDSDMDGDDESEDDTDGEGHGREKSDKSGLANVMAKILGTRKSENVILSKAKKDWTVKKKKDGEADEESFEVVDSSGQIKVEKKVKVEEEDDVKDLSNHEREIMRKVWEKRFRVKPDVTIDYEKERKFKVLATQGVVQLFSAIEKHKNMIQKKLSETRSVMGREKVMETTGKEAFMEMLREQGKKLKKEDEVEGEKEDIKDEVKSEVKDEPIDLPPAPKKPKWNVLSDNFYKEPTLQGWDQQSDEDET